MRTTVTLDDDTAALIRKQMQQREVSFKTALNDAIRAGLIAANRTEPFWVETADMGVPMVNLDKALALAAEIEDEELLRKFNLGK